MHIYHCISRHVQYKDNTRIEEQDFSPRFQEIGIWIPFSHLSHKNFFLNVGRVVELERIMCKTLMNDNLLCTGYKQLASLTEEKGLSDSNT